MKKDDVDAENLSMSEKEETRCRHFETDVKGKIFCDKCGYLLSPSYTHSYFNILGLPEFYVLSLNLLEENYLQRQRLVHPDKFVLKSKEEQKNAENHTALLNEAYRTLRSPFLRGRYLLERMAEQNDVPPTSLNPSFLMEIMEERERLESFTKEEEIKASLIMVKERLALLEQELGQAFLGKNIGKASYILNQFPYVIQFLKILEDK